MTRRRSNRLTEADHETPHAINEEILDDFDLAVHVFLRNCKIRNLSEQTLIYYRSQLTQFRNMLEKQRIATDPNRITAKIIKENVILKLMEDGKKETTINTKLRAIRAFFNFLHKERYIVNNPADDFTLIKQKRTVIETFTREQVQALLRQPDQMTFTGVRDYTMLLLLFETGVRVKELLGIRVEDIRWEDKMIRIRDPKGYKERLVPFQSTVRNQLRKYLSIRGEIDKEILFVNIDNRALTIRTFQERMKQYGRQAGLKNVRCSPHTARHTFAKMSVQNGANVFELQKILGHTSLDMVRNYVNYFSTDVAKAHRKFSPIEKLTI